MSTVDRSPRYPSIGLSEASESIQKLWNKEKRTPVPPDVAATAWGYRSLSGPARSKIGSLKQYGLIERISSGSLKLSELAIEIVAHPAGSKERTAALQRAALEPDLFNRLYSTHRDASNDALRAHLLTKEGFSEFAVKQFIPAFRDTLAVAKLGDDSYTEPEQPEVENIQVGDYVQWESQGVLQFDKPRRVTGFFGSDFITIEGSSAGVPLGQVTKVAPPEESEMGGSRSSIDDLRKPPKTMQEFVVPLSDGSRAVFQWPTSLTKEDVDDLKDSLKILERKISRSAGSHRVSSAMADMTDQEPE